MKKIPSAIVAILSAGAATATAQISTFSGGDPGEGLDLQGTFLAGYAVYAGNLSETAIYTIQDALFENSLVAGGIEISAANQTDFGAGVTDPQGSADDLSLANITNFVRFGGAGAAVGAVGVSITAPLVIGQQYKLQLLFNEACCAGRGFDVEVEGVLVADQFNPSAIQGDTNGANQPGALVTYEFTATDTNLDANLVVAGFADDNAIIDAVSLESVPEPTSVALAMLGGTGLLALRRRRR